MSDRAAPHLRPTWLPIESLAVALVLSRLAIESPRGALCPLH
jgi:hypothetical protein